MNDLINLDTDGGVPTCTSLDIAERFGKLHKNVLRDIENLECSEEFNRLNFEPVEYLDAKGESRRSFNITRDGFAFLVMGFTGPEAAAWKERYIKAFNSMESELRALGAAPLAGVFGLSKESITRINQVAYAAGGTRYYEECRSFLRSHMQNVLTSGQPLTKNWFEDALLSVDVAQVLGIGQG